MTEHTGRGIIESQSRIIAELLEKTSFKEGLRLFLRNIDPENSPQLVRTILGKDVEVPLALMGALPSIANCLIRAIEELIIQVSEKFPPPLLAGFMESLLEEIDKEALARTITNAKGLAEDLTPVFQAAWKAIEERSGRK